MKPYIVVDLDGTLVRGNTFIIYFKMVLRSAPLWAKIRTAILAALNLLHLISHWRMKRAMFQMASVDKLPQKAVERFVADVKSRFNPEVVELIERYRNDGYGVLIATAAMEQYVRLLGFDNYVATPDDGPEYRSEEKLLRVEQWMRSHNGRMMAMVTDHADDAPLIKALPETGKAYLVKSNGEVDLVERNYFGSVAKPG